MSNKNYKDLADSIFMGFLNGNNRSPIINMLHSFKQYFDKDVESENEINCIKQFIFDNCALLEKQGYPQPLFQSIDNENILISWHHAEYFDYSDVLPPNDSFFDIFNWIHSCDGNDFLLACSAFFASIRCNKIFITEKSSDGGVDLVAVNNFYNQIPALFFVQAKTKVKSKISREVLLQEIGKYHNLPQKDIYIKLFNPVDRNLHGCSFIHIFITNCKIKEDAIKEAFFAKSILIDDLRLAFTISKEFTLAQIFEVGETIKFERNSSKFEFDLEYNIANKFKAII